MTKAACSIRWSSYARWTFPRLGFATNERLESMLSKILPCRTFEQLKLPLAIVAADVTTGETVIFREGGLMMPLRASCSFPGLFVPIEHAGRLLVDGAVVCGVPVLALPAMDVTVAVHIQSHRVQRRPASLFEIVGESFRITQNLNQSSWRAHCDLTIEPTMVDYSWDDFGRAGELIAAGEMAAREALPALRRLLRERSAIAEESRNRGVERPEPRVESQVFP
jgi:NTE family protein